MDASTANGDPTKTFDGEKAAVVMNPPDAWPHADATRATVAHAASTRMRMPKMTLRELVPTMHDPRNVRHE